MPEAAEVAQPAPLKPSERQWRVRTAYRDKNGEVVPDTEAMGLAMLELGPILQRLGGVVSIATRRVVVSDTQTETLEVVFRWQAFVPAESLEAIGEDELASEAEEAPVAA